VRARPNESADGGPKEFDGSGGGFSDQGFELGEELLDGINQIHRLCSIGLRLG
jgi:hypothetical protein